MDLLINHSNEDSKEFRASGKGPFNGGKKAVKSLALMWQFFAQDQLVKERGGGGENRNNPFRDIRSAFNRHIQRSKRKWGDYDSKKMIFSGRKGAHLVSMCVWVCERERERERVGLELRNLKIKDLIDIFKA